MQDRNQIAILDVEKGKSLIHPSRLNHVELECHLAAQAAMLHNHEIDRTVQLPVELFSKTACHEEMRHSSSWIHQKENQSRGGHGRVSRHIVSKWNPSRTHQRYGKTKNASEVEWFSSAGSLVDRAG